MTSAKKRTKKGKKTPNHPGIPQEVWLVFVDHSVLGVWLSEDEANKAIQLRRRHSLLEVWYRVAGYSLLGAEQ